MRNDGAGVIPPRSLALVARPLLVLTCSCLLGCSDIASALIDLRLEVRLETQDGHPASGVEVYFQDHGLPRSESDKPPPGAICTTDGDGYCEARVRYRYSEEYFRLPGVIRKAVRRAREQRSDRRFELLVGPEGNRQSLVFLSRPNALQLQGYEVVQVAAVLPAAGSVVR